MHLGPGKLEQAEQGGKMAPYLIGLLGSVLVIYVLARVLSWLRDLAEAKKINGDLIRFQQDHRG